VSTGASSGGARATPSPSFVQASKFAQLLDAGIRIPGTNLRFGLDPILGLVPGVGDAAGAVLASWILVEAVRLGASRDNGKVKLTVADNGVGIPAQHLPHVFDRFYKADQSRSQAGSGLGLSIVKAIIDRHGGTVSVRSEQGAGTVFTILLSAQERREHAL